MPITITKPTVNGSNNTWGTTINEALDTLVDAVNGDVSGGVIDKLIDADAGVVTNEKAVIYGSSGEVAATTVDLGDWTITQSGTDLKFAYNGTDVFKLSSTGALTVEGDVTAFGSA